ncbi:WYL domain-containing protein [Virgibacillus sp. W0430]|uniref:WYL domain-containing protein n=1 Tax=Virgibacillus sp. W0430 TaxID=3391580 RepID=UPI003F45B567
MKKIISRAIQSKEKIDIIYLSRDNQVSRRVIRVLAVNEQYIKAYCFLKKEVRTFRVDNILSLAPMRKKKGA